MVLAVLLSWSVSSAAAADKDYLRWALMEAALHACRYPPYAERHARTKRRLGKQRGPKVAQIEIAHKLAEAIRCMLTRNRPFAPAGAAPAVAAWTALTEMRCRSDVPIPPGPPAEEAMER